MKDAALDPCIRRRLQNKPRGRPQRTPPEIEDRVVAISQESLSPERPHHRRYAAAKVARLLQQRYGVTLSRKTVWLILRRRGVWQQPVSDQRAVQRFEQTQPNDLGWSVWVAADFDQDGEITAGKTLISRYDL